MCRIPGHPPPDLGILKLVPRPRIMQIPLVQWKTSVFSFAVNPTILPLAFVNGDWHKILCLGHRAKRPQCPSAVSMLHVILEVSLVNESKSDKCAIELNIFTAVGIR